MFENFIINCLIGFWVILVVIYVAFQIYWHRGKISVDWKQFDDDEPVE